MGAPLSIPPKMLAKLAQQARDGMADNYLGRSIAEFYRGNIQICLVSYKGDGNGWQMRVSQAEMARLKEQANPSMPKAEGK